jgi:hypothetical protein
MSKKTIEGFLDWYRENKRFKHRITMLSIFEAGYNFAMKEKNNDTR